MHEDDTSEKDLLRTQFQIDRIAFFSDAVMAIAITLLVMEIKITPVGKNATWQTLITQYQSSILQHIVTLFICFAAIGELWIRHHEIFEFIKGYSKILIKVNLYFLFSITLLPLSISFSQEDNPKNMDIFILIANLFFCFLLFYILILIILNKKNSFHHNVAGVRIQEIKRRIFLTVVTLFLVCVMSLVDTKLFYLPFFILFVDRIRKVYNRYIQKRNRKHTHF